VPGQPVTVADGVDLAFVVTHLHHVPADEAVREAKLRRMMAAETQRKARRADAAARSQRQVARASGGGGGSTIEGPPAHIRSNPDAMTDWVARNPKQAIAYANSLRG